jgi:hypothetical protein
MSDEGWVMSDEEKPAFALITHPSSLITDL